MVDVRMPDGVVVRFPDNMSREQIKAMILTKFPDAAAPKPAQQIDDTGTATAPADLKPGSREYADWARAQAIAGNKLPQVSNPAITETESSILDPFVQGTTFGFADELRGAVQGGLAAVQGGDFGSVYDQTVDESRNALNHEREVNPVGSFAAEVAGAIPTGVGLGGGLVRGATVGARALRGAAVGAGQGAIYGFGASEGETLPERAIDGAIGGGLGLGIGAVAPYIGQAAKRLITPLPAAAQTTAAAKTLVSEGIDLTAGQRTGSKALQYVESELGGGAAANFMERQGEQFTAAALKRAGIQSSRATPDVIDGAFDTLGQQFDSMAAVTRTRFDPKLRTTLNDVLDDYLHTSGMPAPGVQFMIDRVRMLAQGNNGLLTGRQYQNLRSKLGQLMRAADPPTRMAFHNIREALDDALERYTTGDTLKQWQTLRRQYQNLLVLEKAATGAGANAASGLLSPAQLRNAAINQSRRTFARGGNDFGELTNAAVKVMSPLPQSGTAPRLAVRGLPAMLGAAAGSPGGVLGAMGGAALGAAAPALAGRAILSRPGRALLSNQRAATQSASTLEELIRAMSAPTIGQY